MYTYNRLTYYVKAVFGIFILFLLWRWTWIVFSKNEVEYFYYLLYSFGRDMHMEYQEKTYIHVVFIGLRVFLFITSTLLAYRFFRAIREGTPVIHSSENRLFNGIATSIDDNRNYIKGLDKGVWPILTIMLIILASIMIFHLFTKPYHYDEMLTYTMFTGKGLLADITFYPVPNNHIFYSVVSTLFQILPIDIITAMRLPNVLAAFFTAYYFFKTAALLMGRKTALATTAIFAFSFPFLIYSVQARGYGIFLFFAVLLVYSSIQLLKKENADKYWVAYAVSAVLGAYTIPTFIYVLVPIGIVLFIFTIFNRKEVKPSTFFKTHFAIGIFTFLLYLPLFLANGWNVFQKAQAAGVTPIQPPFSKANIITHLEETWSYITSGASNTPWLCLLIVAALAVSSFSGQQLRRYASLMFLLLLISPLPIILLQKAIPFSRTWVHLMIPVAIGLGLIIQCIATLIKGMQADKRMTLTAGFVVAYSAVLFGCVHQMYLGIYRLDHVVRDYITLLKNDLPYVKTIDRTNDLSFYLAEDIQFEAKKLDRNITLNVIGEADSQKAELIIAVPEANLQISDNYRLVQVDNPYFKVYIRKDL